MKKLKLLVIVVFAILMIPVGVFADENEEVNVYFFKGDGCGYCEAGLEWFGEIEDRYGERFKLHEYETWYDKDNAALMDAVAKIRGEDVKGVPYIIIGDQSWNGFDDSYKDEIIDKIRSEYKTAVEERYDVMNYVEDIPSSEEKDKKDGYADDIAITVLFLLVIAGTGFGIYSLRKSN